MLLSQQHRRQDRSPRLVLPECRETRHIQLRGTVVAGCASRHVQSAASSLPPLIFLFNPAAGLNEMAFLAAITCSVWVLGFRPIRSVLDKILNVPKFVICSSPSLMIASQIYSMTCSTNSAASLRGSDAAAYTASANSLRFIVSAPSFCSANFISLRRLLHLLICREKRHILSMG